MGQAEHLSFFASPLHTGGHGHGHAHGSFQGVESKPLEPQPYEPVQTEHAADAEAVPFGHDEALHKTPEFHKRAEATTSELFYDLFFVANLTTFTSLLEINDHKSLSAYIGFFSILWLTWYQVSLYDVRFSTDSVFERCAKAIHFGTMVGFAVMGPQWKPGKATSDYTTFKAFSLIFMVSRFTLVLQYGVTLFFSRRYTKTRLPLLLVMSCYAVAGILYGALTAAFPDGSKEVESNVYVAWYIIAIMETILVVSVSCVWRVISFKGTHMVQRMSLLTLIILGEGIIVVCKAISKIVKNQYIFSAAVVGQIICSILIIYFLYMLYFDQLSEEHFGTIKQQIWSILHFPLHLCLVLVLQGVEQFVVWRQAVEGVIGLASSLNAAFNFDTVNVTEYIQNINDTVHNNVWNYVPEGIDISAALKEYNDGLEAIASNIEYPETNATAMEAVSEGLSNVVYASTNAVLESMSINAPDKKVKAKDKEVDPTEQFSALFEVFQLVYTYFFVTAGLTLLVITSLSLLSMSKNAKTISNYARHAFNFTVGITLCLLSLMKLNPDRQGQYSESPWVLPTLCLALFACVVGNHVHWGAKGKGH